MRLDAFGGCILLSACLLSQVHAEPMLNKSFQGKYKATAHSCVAAHCDDQAETITGAFYIGAKNAHVYSGTNKGLVLPFGQRHRSNEGMNVWIVPTSSGFDESYAKDGFTITHHYAMHPDRTCSVSVSVVKAPSDVSTSYRTDMESCTVAEGNIFAP